MSLIRASAQLLRTGALTRSLTVNRGAIHLDQDWMPGPYPKNQEERLAAAKKYNLLPEEYEPYPPDMAIGFGDYPKLPNISLMDKDPYRPWDYMSHGTDYGQAVNIAQNEHGMNCPSFEDRDTASLEEIIFFYVVTLTVTYIMIYYGEKYRAIPPVKPKHYPINGDFYHYPSSDISAYEPIEYTDWKSYKYPRHGHGHH